MKLFRALKPKLNMDKNEVILAQAINEVLKVAKSKTKCLIIYSGYVRDSVILGAIKKVSSEFDKYIINPNYKLVNLNTVNIVPCVGCFAKGPAYCVSPCVINEPGNVYENKADEMIYQDIKDSDIISVFSSSYNGMLPSNLIKLIERSESLINARDYYKEDMISGKIGFGVITSTTDGADTASSSLLKWFQDMHFMTPSPGVVSWNGRHSEILKSAEDKCSEDDSFFNDTVNIVKEASTLFLKTR